MSAPRPKSKKVDALGQRVRDRFNEEIAYPQADQKSCTAVKLKAGNLDQLSQATGQSDILSRRS